MSRESDLAMKLAAESCLQVAECYKIIATIHDVVMEAARPHLERAYLHAALAERAAMEARRAATEARMALCGVSGV